MRILIVALIVMAFLSFNGCTVLTAEQRKRTTALHELACSPTPTASSAWHIKNLYNCDTRQFYIPYQLWTGATWDGYQAETCMHTANSRFNVDGDSETTIKGPEIWKSPQTGIAEPVWVRDKVTESKTQYFTCHEKGIGRVYDNRRPKYYRSGRCKFPAGHGWMLFHRRYCSSTSIEIIAISFDDNAELHELVFKWWRGKTLDHIYRYVPNTGMTHAWEQ